MGDAAFWKPHGAPQYLGSQILLLGSIDFAHKPKKFYIFMLYSKNTLSGIVNLNILELLLTFWFFLQIYPFLKEQMVFRWPDSAHTSPHS